MNRDMPIFASKTAQGIGAKEIVRLGSNKPISVDIRIIAATNQNLEKMIRKEHFVKICITD